MEVIFQLSINFGVFLKKFVKQMREYKRKKISMLFFLIFEIIYYVCAVCYLLMGKQNEICYKISVVIEKTIVYI